MPESLFNKVAGLRSATLLRKRLLAQMFPCEFCEIFKNTSFTEHLWGNASEKSNTHGFSLKDLKLMNNYLSKKNQRTKINESYSSWEQILFWSTWRFGAILFGAVLFNMFLSDLFRTSNSIDIARVMTMTISLIKHVTTLKMSSEKLLK